MFSNYPEEVQEGRNSANEEFVSHSGYNLSIGQCQISATALILANGSHQLLFFQLTMKYPIKLSTRDEIKPGVFIETTAVLDEYGELNISTRSWTIRLITGAHSRAVVYLFDEDGNRLWNTNELQCGIGGKLETLIPIFDPTVKSDRTENYKLSVPLNLALQAKFIRIVHYDKVKSIDEYLRIINKFFDTHEQDKNQNTIVYTNNGDTLYISEIEAIFKGDTMIDQSRNVNISNGTVNAGAGAFNLGDISGNVTNTINQLPESPEPERPGIKELLKDLQVAIEAETNLSDEDKAEALEQVKALAEASKDPQEASTQKSAKTAIKILKGTVASLPSVATLAEACTKLLPLIAKFLGLPI